MMQNHFIRIVGLLPVCCMVAACQTMTEQVVPHPRHAEKSVQEAVTEIFDGLARMQGDIEESLQAGGSADRGRIFLHVRGAGVGPGLAVILLEGLGNVLEDAGYEIVLFEELEPAIERQSGGGAPAWDDRTAYAAARALNSYEGAGAADIYVTSVESLGLGEPNFEGQYEERLRVDVTTTFYAARWGDVVFRDRTTLTSRAVYRQAERFYSEKVHRMSTRDRSLYRLLRGHMHALLPRFPERPR